MRGLICYDFTDTRARTRFSNILKKYGFRVQYSIFEFNLDRETWTRLIKEVQKKKLLKGNYNIIVIPITDSVYNKMIYLGDFYMAFDYDSLICSAFGVEGINQKEGRLRLGQKELSNLTDADVEHSILDKFFDE